MPRPDPDGHVDRRYSVIVLDLPTIYGEASEEERKVICDRIEQLLDLEVRFVLLAEDRLEAVDRNFCANITGLSKVFLFVRTPDGRLFGYDQWGKAVPLAESEADHPHAAAELVADAVVEPADFGPEAVLILAEDYGDGRPAAGFLAPGFDEARRVALTSAGDVPEGVRRAAPEAGTLIRLLGAALWQWS